MGHRINLLMIEDQPDDADLILRAMRRAGYEVNFQRVFTAPQMSAALQERTWDLIISDHNLPGFSSFGALKVLRESGLDVPFLVVSGTIGEETAVETMKSGAQDYIMKTNLARLIPAIERELREVAERRGRREVSRNLASVEENFRLFVESVKDYAIMMLDHEGHIISWNPGAERIFGYKEEEILGRSLRIFYVGEDRDSEVPERELNIALATGRSVSERWLLRQDQTRFWGSEVLTSLRDESGRERGFVKVVRDMTARKQLENEQLRAREEAEAASQAKTNFLANVSHELRTPLSAIIGFVDLLRGPDATSSDKVDFIETIRRNAEQLVKLIDDLLDITKVESGRLNLEKISINLMEFLHETEEVLKLRALEKDIGLHFVFRGPMPATIISDPTRLRQILLNVIGNSIKFTQSGGVKVVIHAEASETEGALVFLIRDTGIGMNEEQKTQIFQPFVQADSSMTRRFGGTGLGLILSKTLAESMGGHLRLLSSEVGRGSDFEIRVLVGPMREMQPVVGQPVEKAMPPPKSAPSGGGHELLGKRILYVEDAPDNQFLINRYLKMAGAQVVIANDGIEGVEKGLQGNFDLILMDLQMPRLDGYGATRQLREGGYAKPILALSAHAMETEKRQSIAAGCNDHLTKPLTRSFLISKILEYLPPEQSSPTPSP
ncbi:MAG: response regulator [Bdellovibrionaceae bacterium]|nr:response regulator [Pseudobdellovibrionaceae bacterium]